MKDSRKLFKKLLIVLSFFFFVPIVVHAEKEMYKAGVVFYNQGNYKQALQYLSEFVKKEPDDIQALYYFANTLVKTHNVDYAKKYYERVIAISPMSEYARYSSIALHDITTNKASIDLPIDSMYVNDRQLFNSENSYIKDIMQSGKIVHWDKDKMPLKVYVHSSKYKEYNKYVWDAFDDWSKLSRGVVFFDKVDSEDSANIVIKWGDQFEDDVDDDLYGCSVPQIEENNLVKFTIYLLNKDYEGNIIMPNDLYTNALHQIGHSLGINAHSKDPNDIMYVDGNFGEISRRDVSTLNLLYQLEPQVSNFLEYYNSDENNSDEKTSN